MGAVPSRFEEFDAEVIQGYTATDPDHLSLKVGMSYTVTKASGSNYYGHLAQISNAKQGWFPKRCVNKIIVVEQVEKIPRTIKLDNTMRGMLPQVAQGPLVQCRTCQGEGFLHRTTGGSYEYRKPYTEQCPGCGGTGQTANDVPVVELSSD